MTARPRIFQIGFNRCGTTSLHAFFVKNGIPSIHWDRGRIGIAFWRRMAAREDPFLDYPNVVAFTDMMYIAERMIVEPYKHLDYILQFYPDGLFILNVRDREKWIASREHHVIPMQERYSAAFGIAPGDVVAYWREEWDRHLRYVQAMLGGSDRLLVFDIEKDDPNKLTDFLAPHFGPLDPPHYGWHHPRAEPQSYSIS